MHFTISGGIYGAPIKLTLLGEPAIVITGVEAQRLHTGIMSVPAKERAAKVAELYANAKQSLS